MKMNKIFNLTSVFVKEFYQNIDIFNKEKKKFNKRNIFFWLVAIVSIGILYISYEIINFLINIGQPDIFLHIFFPILATFLIFQIILVCSNIFFFSKDIENVLYMPLKPSQLLFAKLNTLLCMSYATEIIFALLPLTMYGLLTNAHIIFYLWELVILIIFPIFLAVIISSVMLIIMRFAKFVRNKDVFQLVITLILVAIFCILEFKLLQGQFSVQNGQEYNQIISINEIAQNVSKYFLVINPSVDILINSSNIVAILSFLKLIFYNIVGIGIFITIGKLTYLKDVLKNLTNYIKSKNKKVNLEKEIKCESISKSYIVKEIKMLVREPIFLLQCVLPVVIIVISCIVLILTLMPLITEIIKDETISNELKKITFNSEMLCDFLIIMQVLFTISNISLTTFSRDGKNAIFVKYIPVELYRQFIYKGIIQVVLNFLVSVVVIGIIWYFIPSINILYLMGVLIIALLMNMINSHIMILVDLQRPNLNWDSTYSVVKKIDNKFFQYGLMIIIILFLMYMATLLKEVNIFIVLVCEAIIFVCIFLIIDRCIKKFQNKLFNKII